MSRDTVLTLLRASGGAFLSGEELSRRLGLSRTAIWKAVDALRKDGYDIEARTSMGYRLVAAPDALTEAEIRPLLRPTAFVGRELRCFDEIDSTNTYAKQIALEGAADGTVVVANCQTAGRGRMDRSFQSPRDKGIYLTVLLRPDLPTERLMPVTALAGVRRSPRTEVAQRPGVGRQEALRYPDGTVRGGRIGAAPVPGIGHRHQCAPHGGGLFPGRGGHGYLPRHGVGAACDPARSGGGADRRTG